MIGRGYSSKRIKQLFERAQLGEQHTARIEAYLDKDSPRYIFIHGIALKKQLNRMQHLREKLQPEDGRMNVQKLLCKTLRTRLFTNLAEIQSYMLERGVTVTLRRLKM